ncbi:MAG TPA: N-acetylmuramoyl-L-alanine amidase [Candidatus Eremiobacteraceae bacterium]|nr:N-acetylmuramoyl-L-alanine amidase [Candidatus Eremiobacteraceae bacterium]
MSVPRAARALVIAAALVLVAGPHAAGAFGISLTPSDAQVWVAGRQIPFAHLGIAYGDPVAPVDDPGVTAMLAAVAARADWQPGTRFVAVTRGDGKLVTFALGSNAVSVDGTPVSMPFAPFTDDERYYLPLLPLARALGLAVRGFHAGYVFVPQIVDVAPRAAAERTSVIEILGSAPLAWRSDYEANERSRTLRLTFAGFGTAVDLTGVASSPPVASLAIAQTGPPGYPSTTITIGLMKDAKFAARRTGLGVDLQLIVAPSESALRARTVAALVDGGPRAIVDQTATPAPPAPQPTASPIPATPTPAASSQPSPLPAESGQVEPGGVATAEPLGPESPGASSTPGAAGSTVAPSTPMPEQKITDVAIEEVATGSRILLTLTGPVTFEWHRLGDPDDRYWLDIHGATLVGPARTLTSALPFIKEIKVSQHAIAPDRIVRVAITPSQAIDVRAGAIEGEPNVLGVEIENQPPSPDESMAGASAIGMTVAITTPAASTAPTPSTEPAPTDPDLIVIDPGHGGNDPGSLNPAYGLTESHLTLAIAQRLAADLKHAGWQVTLTRDGDYEVGDPDGTDAQELQARCDVANAAGARLFVSVHINASVSSSPNGTTTYYWRPADRAFAQTVQTALVASLGTTDDGVKREEFYVIHHTVMPAILVESAYLSNPHDATLLTDTTFLYKIADGIAQGIGDYTGGPPAAVGQKHDSNDRAGARR